MAPVQLMVKTDASDSFEIEIDDSEDVASLTAMIMSLRPDLGEGLRLAFKGRALKEEDLVSSMEFKAGDFIALARKRTNEEVSEPIEADMPTEAGDVAQLVQQQNQVSAETLEELCSMGFDRSQAEKALRAAFNNLERAVEYLTEGIPEEVSQAASTPQQPQQPAPQPTPAAVPTPAPTPAPAPGTAPAVGGAVAEWWESMMGPQLLTKSGLQPVMQAFGGASVVLLYFSAHWCPPCRQFTPEFARRYQGGQVVVVFVSSDKTEAEFNAYYAEMPWLAVPYAAQQRQLLGQIMQVRGIPTVIAWEIATQRFITNEARKDLTSTNFDFAACLRQWGVNSTAPQATIAAAPAPATGYPAQGSAASSQPPAAPKEPEPLPINDAAVDEALARVENEEWEVQEPFFRTGMKVLENALHNPKETKFHHLKKTNAALSGKLLDVAEGAGLALLKEAGFADEEGAETLSLSGAPDGKCTAVRDKLKAAFVKASENEQRKVRDARIAEEKEKDRQRQARYSGEGGRMELGAGRKPAGGGG